MFNCYYRLIPKHIFDLLLYPSDVLNHLSRGGFVMNLSARPWSSIFLDENHETTINKDVKDVVSSLSAISISGKMHYLPYRAGIQKQCKVNVQNRPSGHGQCLSRDTFADAKINEDNVLSYLGKLKSSALFSTADNVVKELNHLFTGETASAAITESMCDLVQLGDNRLEQYVKACMTGEVSMRDKQKRPYKFTCLKNFGEIKSKTRNEKSVEKFHKSCNDFLRRYLEWCRINKIPPDDIQQFITIPMALAEPNGHPYKQPKSDAVQYYKKHFSNAFIETLADLQKQPETLIIDAMVIVYENRPLPSHNTFGDYGNYLFEKWVLNKFRNENFLEVHVCFDQQNVDRFTPKSFERNRRDNNTTASYIFREVNCSSYRPNDWPSFLSNRANKRKFVEFLGHFFIQRAEVMLAPKQVLVVSGGFTQSKENAHVVTSTQPNSSKNISSFRTDALFSNHLEGDSLVWLHAVNCVQGRSPIVIYSIDSDIPHIGMPLVGKLPNRHFIVQTRCTLLDLNLLMTEISKNNELRCMNCDSLSEEMQAIFVLSGCDYVSSFRNCSKRTFYNVYLDHCHFISKSYEGSLSQSGGEDWKAGLLAFYRLIGSIYFKKCVASYRVSMSLMHNPSPEDVFKKFIDTYPGMGLHEVTLLWLDDIRGMIMKGKGLKSEEKWLPSNTSLALHWQRCCYVLQIWKQADINEIKYPNIEDWGWCISGENLLFQWDSDENIKKVENYRKLWTGGCNCRAIRSPCANRICGCRKLDKTCGPSCKCSSNCCNKPEDPSIEGLLKGHNTNSEDSNVELDVQIEECLTDDELDYPSEWDYSDVEDFDVVDYDGVINSDDDNNIGGHDILRDNNIFAGLQISE